MMEWFKTLKQKAYVKKIAKAQGSKGLQKLINIAMEEMHKKEDNTISQKTREDTMTLLSDSLKS